MILQYRFRGATSRTTGPERAVKRLSNQSVRLQIRLSLYHHLSPLSSATWRIFFTDPQSAKKSLQAFCGHPPWTAARQHQPGFRTLPHSSASSCGRSRGRAVGKDIGVNDSQRRALSVRSRLLQSAAAGQELTPGFEHSSLERTLESYLSHCLEWQPTGHRSATVAKQRHRRIFPGQ